MRKNDLPYRGITMRFHAVIIYARATEICCINAQNIGTFFGDTINRSKQSAFSIEETDVDLLIDRCLEFDCGVVPEWVRLVLEERGTLTFSFAGTPL